MGFFGHKKRSLEDIEKKIAMYKDRIFESERQDDYRYHDLQAAFGAMETNYQKIRHSNLYPESKILEFAEDMEKYADSLARIKFGRFITDNDSPEERQAHFERLTQEPFALESQIKEKFRSLLTDNFQEVDY